MELRHLRYFVVVAEELHFRRAAERLHMSQPPLSQQIRQLEEEVGATLLLRNQRKVELTAAGAAFLVRAREILDAVEDAARQARRVQRGEVGRLAVGFVGSAMYSFVPELLRAFREHAPDIALRLHELGTTRAAAPARGRPARRRLRARCRGSRPGADVRDRARGAGRGRAAGRAPARASARCCGSRDLEGEPLVLLTPRGRARAAGGAGGRDRRGSAARSRSCRRWRRCRP